MRIAIAVVCAALMGLAAQTAHAADVQMLPPTLSTGSPCAFGGTNQVMVLNGTGAAGQNSAINCDTMFTADPVSGTVAITGFASVTGSGAGFAVYDRDGSGANSQFYRSSNVTGLWDNTYGNVLTYNSSGNVTVVNTLQIGGSGQLTSASANMLLNLENNGKCPHGNMALFQNTSGNFYCVDVSDIVNSAGAQMGVAMLPSCAVAGAMLTSTDGISFTCIVAPQGPTGATGAGCSDYYTLNNFLLLSPIQGPFVPSSEYVVNVSSPYGYCGGSSSTTPIPDGYIYDMMENCGWDGAVNFAIVYDIVQFQCQNGISVPAGSY